MTYNGYYSNIVNQYGALVCIVGENKKNIQREIKKFCKYDLIIGDRINGYKYTTELCPFELYLKQFSMLDEYLKANTMKLVSKSEMEEIMNETK